MKKIVIVHGWGSNPDEPVLLWIANECKKQGYEVIRPAMPNPETPTIDVWVSYLSSIVGTPDENTYFVGHSIGCQTIMRYLETLPEDVRVGGAVFIAGWFNLAGLEEEGEDVVQVGKPWIETPIHFEKIKNICPKISVFISSNEPYGFVEENKKMFEEKLNADVVILKSRGHFAKEDGIVKLPEALEALNKMIEK